MLRRYRKADIRRAARWLPLELSMEHQALVSTTGRRLRWNIGEAAEVNRLPTKYMDES